MTRLAIFVCLTHQVACAKPPPTTLEPRAAPAPLSRAADAAMILVPGGESIAGSTAEEREQAYADAERTSGRDGARRGRWFANEKERQTTSSEPFVLDRTHVTNAQYAEFVVAASYPWPTIGKAAWLRQGYVQKYETQVARYNWQADAFPKGRGDHPVLLVTHAEATAYCRWRGTLFAAKRRLPTAAEFERAARGTDGRLYPWGGAYDASQLNDMTNGPADTVPVGSFPDSTGPHGHLDLAGNAFSWTSTPWRTSGEYTVKGSAWDDHAGVGRGAANHGRPETVRHAIVGFRCAGKIR